MRLRSIALLLLLALSLRLGAGPHPCHAMVKSGAPGMADMPAMAGHASCHQGSRPKAPVPGSDDCCKGDHALCERGCQTAAVLQVDLPAPAVLPFEEQISFLEDRSTPPFVFSIDHVPLA